jgi:hypothetical protein
MSDLSRQISRHAVVASEGVTASERYLGKLCKRSFLSLWSYPGVFRNQTWGKCKSNGKEVCDVLVVFENHIIIFSDKQCEFPDSGNLEVDWGRWYRRAISKSAEQVWGAERWIREFPDRLFLDIHCTKPFPITLPRTADAIFHRIVVAHDGSSRCRQSLGGSGSLMLNSSVIGENHFHFPFTVGQINPEKGYVHVFDDTTLDIVMTTLDTITDFTAYLTKKERFLTGNKTICAAGEEELLAVYLRKLNAYGEHDFVIAGDYDFLSFDEGLWEDFSKNPQRMAQIERDKVSYVWDELIERFVLNAMAGTQYLSGGPLSEQETMFRFLAREPRTRRRMLAISFLEVWKRSIKSPSFWQARVMLPSGAGDPYYVFLFLKRREGDSDAEYRKIRVQLLSDYCRVVKLEHPEAMNIVGIASEAGDVQRRSEDLLYLDGSKWTAEAEAEAREIQQKIGILKKTRVEMRREHEYPVDREGNPRSTGLSRNSPCSCGSGKRFTHCCGKKLFGKRYRRK